MKQNRLKTSFFIALGIWVISVVVFGALISVSKNSHEELNASPKIQEVESQVENIPFVYRTIYTITASKSTSASKAYSDFVSCVLIDSEYTLNSSEFEKLRTELDLRSENYNQNYDLALDHIQRKIVTEYYAVKWKITPDEEEIAKLVSAGLSQEEAEYSVTENAVINRLFFFSPSLKGGLPR